MKNGKRIKAKLVTVLTAVLTVFVMMPQMAAPANAEGWVVPEANYTHDQDNNWAGTLLINENETVKISGITHDNTGTIAGPAIKISGGATVNLVFEGANVLTANPKMPGAGIEVENGSTVNIYGLEGSSLDVTGGQFGAGIGGGGYSSGGESNPSAGNINIYSGNITAAGGSRGAGIGSGYHQSAGVINIKGGNITAFGNDWGAGIGSGYGSSGGAREARMGFYDGGTITISGGTVKAAAYSLNFRNFDQYNTGSLYGEGFADNCAAGIGGGYGSSSGTIVIEGDADVTAIGGAGGAGIGTGRGTTNPKNYDSEKASCDITIGGNAKVVAMASIDTRGGNYTTAGGAAIGWGRGWLMVNDIGDVSHDNPKGSVKIEGNANVYACAPDGANAIGTGYSVSGADEPPMCHLKTLTIGDSTTVVAVSNMQDQEHDALSISKDNVTVLNFEKEFFENNSDFFTEDKFSLKIEAVSRDDAAEKTIFAIQNPNKMQAAVHLPSASENGMYFTTKDYQADDGSRILLTNGIEHEAWQFLNKTYSVEGLIDETYSVKYHPNGADKASLSGGTWESDDLFTAEYSVLDINPLTLQTPFRSGYDFAGWYENNGLTGNKVTAYPDNTTGDKEVWAKWTANAKAVSATPLMATMTAKGDTGLNFAWNAISGAEGYDIFLAECVGNGKCKLAGTAKDGNSVKWSTDGLKTKHAYKAYVKAYVTKNGNKSYVATSPTVHAYTKGFTKKYTNAKSIKVKKSKVSLKAGKTAKIKAKVKKLKKGKRIMPGHELKIRYLSSDTKIATVTSKGKIKGVSKGTCKIYVFAHNGVYKTVKVTVK